MYKTKLPENQTLATYMQKRRNMDLERQDRIFNAKIRTIGVDKEALDIQVNEKKLRKEKELEKHNTYAESMILHDKINCLLDDREKKDMYNLNKAINDFRSQFQKMEDRREFDLNDPQELKKDIPARIADDDPRLCVSGVQKMVGEDLDQPERYKCQQEQLREWLLQQQSELQKAQQEHRIREDLYDDSRIQLDRIAVELQKIDEDIRKRNAVATKEFNMKKATEKSLKKKQEKELEEQDNMAEISNVLQGDLISENPDQAISAFGPHRVIPDRWKGMNSAQLQEIRNTWEKQIHEKQRSKEEEKNHVNEWDQRRISSDRAAILMERHQTRINKGLRRAMDDTNKHLSVEQKAQNYQPLLECAFLEQVVRGHR
ncbi:RIB43A-like with coiled-coils protein 2 isoform X1 [Polypterus senegalus]|uniref:RIB43A-like with coiled-coils protein 2 isoform X1 n=2 Tax=Polypterus senegalus TaxID=55291 RepID=UPI0019627646|nr:RIB43A-like with coiled-coils protein 2 isoform X1 [Polypterus senegalus]